MAPKQIVEFTAFAQGTGPMTYQWFKDGREIVGAKSSSYTLQSPSTVGAFLIHARIGNDAGAAFTDAILVSVIDLPQPVSSGGLVNLSVRSLAGLNGTPLTLGFIPSGPGGVALLVRAIGPELAVNKWVVAGTLSDPEIKLYNGLVGIGSNDNWGAYGQAPIMQNLMSRVGAFSLSDQASKDSAFYALADGARTVQVSSRTAGEHGIVLLELYDCAANAKAHLINGSVRNYAGAGDDTLILGFTLSGTQPRKVLIRGIGPSLAKFSVSNVLLKPRLELYTSNAGTNNTIIASNERWGGGAALVAAFAAGGAFPLDATSNDAALVATLAPGQYSALLSGLNGTTGIALVEIYDITGL